MTRALWVHSNWAERHPGQQPSAAAIFVDSVIRQPFAELTIWQMSQKPVGVECIAYDEAEQRCYRLCNETFGSLHHLHAACRSLALQACVSCDFRSTDSMPAFILTFQNR